MEPSPHELRATTFSTTRKGYEPDEVDAFVTRAADALEAAQNHATAMEAKARAAVAKLQELSAASAPASAPASTDRAVEVPADRAEEITRTLLLAQRAADEAVAEARAEAEDLLRRAREDASTTVESSRSMAEQLVEEARSQARTAGADERRKVRSEVEALLARREFLVGDVDQLERFLEDQRSRLRDAAATIVELTDRVPGGLGAARPPLLSAADGDPPTDVPTDDESGSDAHADEAVDDAVDPDATLAIDLVSERDEDHAATAASSAAAEDPGASEGATDASDVQPGDELAPDDPTPVGEPGQLRFRPEAFGGGDTAAHR